MATLQNNSNYNQGILRSGTYLTFDYRKTDRQKLININYKR